MSYFDVSNIKRECIISGTSDIIITENGEAVLCKSSDNSKFMTSNIFAARIAEYAPQLYSYFVDIGDSRRAMLGSMSGGEEASYRSGDFCLVQVTSAPRDKKGAYVSDKIRLTGVYTVLLPCEKKAAVNISAKIKNKEERERLSMIGESLESQYSIIMRTEAAGASAGLIAEDHKRLTREWKDILQIYEEKKSNGSCGSIRLRDPLVCEIMKYPASSYSEICADTPDMMEYIKRALPQLSDKLKFIPKRIFAVKSVDNVKSALLGKKVYLKSGADIVIEKTEALTVIDVNTGGSKLSYKDVNKEAAREIMRQLRLRDIGGMVVCDFIEMNNENDKQELTEYMRRLAYIDPSKPEIFGLTALGLMEITRKRS